MVIQVIMKSVEIISLEMDHLENNKINCKIITCQVDKKQLSALIIKKLGKISSQQECDKHQPPSPPVSPQDEKVEQSPKTSIEEEVNTRNDEGYLEWKNWMERDKLQRDEAASQRLRAKLKTDQWALVRECTRLMGKKQEKVAGKERTRGVEKAGR